jgi:MFS family permease
VRPSSGVRFADLLPRLLSAAFVEWLGTGLFLAVSTTFFVKVVGLTVTQVGFGLALAGGVAMGTTVPIGRLGDQLGPRNVLVAVNLARAAATVCYLLVEGWWSFLGISVVVAVTEQAAPPLLQALVGDTTRPDLRTRVLAAHRTVVNVGISVGGLIAGGVLGSGMGGAYEALFVADSVAFLAATALLLRLPSPPSRPCGSRSTPSGRWALLRDRRLLALTAYDSVISLWQPMLNVAFPLWLLTRTDAPAGWIGVLYAVNTGLCVVLQYSTSALVATPRRALRSYAVAATLLAISSVAFAAAPAFSGAGTIVAFVVAIGILTFGELIGMAAAWTLSFAIPPDDRRGAYLAAFALGRITGTRVGGPLLMSGVVLASGTRGWLLLAALFACATIAPLVVARRLVSCSRSDLPTSAES